MVSSKDFFFSVIFLFMIFLMGCNFMIEQNPPKALLQNLRWWKLTPGEPSTPVLSVGTALVVRVWKMAKTIWNLAWPVLVVLRWNGAHSGQD